MRPLTAKILFYVTSPRNENLQSFFISDNRQVEYLPRHISEILPNLTEFSTTGCGLTVVRKFYFKSMHNLAKLHLCDNSIAIIEDGAFADLVNVERLHLNNNLIETLDETLFISMIKLKTLFLENNKIKYLSPPTFNIPGGNLKMIFLRSNKCINRVYSSTGSHAALNSIEHDLQAKCAQESVSS